MLQKRHCIKYNKTTPNSFIFLKFFVSYNVEILSEHIFSFGIRYSVTLFAGRFGGN